MSIILTLVLLLSGTTFDVYDEFVENNDGILTDEQHFYTVVENYNGDVLLTIDYDASSDDINVIY